MVSLLDKLSELLKSLKDQKIRSLIQPIPTLKTPNPPSMNARTPAPTKLPGAAPTGKKDPKKIAQQIKDGSMSTKTQKVMLKFDKNGQWSLE